MSRRSHLPRGCPNKPVSGRCHVTTLVLVGVVLLLVLPGAAAAKINLSFSTSRAAPGEMVQVFGAGVLGDDLRESEIFLVPLAAAAQLDGTSTPPSVVVGSALGPLRSDPQVVTIPRVAPGRYALAVWCAKCVPQTLYVMKPAASGSASGVIEIASVGQGAAGDSSMFTIVLTGVIVAGTAACVVAVWRARKPRQRSTSLG